MLFLGPGSFLEVEKVLPLLTNPEDTEAPAFHVVALSLPGYTFSEGSRKYDRFSHYQNAEVRMRLHCS
jgi:hypothetical protein